MISFASIPPQSVQSLPNNNKADSTFHGNTTLKSMRLMWAVPIPSSNKSHSCNLPCTACILGVCWRCSSPSSWDCSAMTGGKPIPLPPSCSLSESQDILFTPFTKRRPSPGSSTRMTSPISSYRSPVRLITWTLKEPSWAMVRRWRWPISKPPLQYARSWQEGGCSWGTTGAVFTSTTGNCFRMWKLLVNIRDQCWQSR